MTETERDQDRRASMMSSILVASMVVVLLGGGFWGLSRDRGDHDHGEFATIGETVELPEGLIRVDAVRPEIMAAMIMPRSLMPDPVPDGYRRFVVDLSVVATTDEGLTYDIDRFSVSGDTLSPTPVHRAVTRPGVVPRGSQATFSVLFDTPLEAETLFLRIDGADREVLLEGDLGDGHNHGEAPADLVISGFFEAEIEDFAFLPDDMIIEVGTDIRFHNHDSVIHDVVARDGSWNTNNLRTDENSEVIRFDEAGTFNYFCSIHPTMTGTINVVSS